LNLKVGVQDLIALTGARVIDAARREGESPTDSTDAGLD
jgi:hypothetical protein